MKLVLLYKIRVKLWIFILNLSIKNLQAIQIIMD